MNKNPTSATNKLQAPLEEQLRFLRLTFTRENYESMATKAAEVHWSHIDYLANLIEGEAAARRDRAAQRRIRLARFPVIKTLDQFRWSWPKAINRMAVQNLFRLKFIEQKSNVIFLGGVGLGKTHLATALGYAACLQRYSVLFTTAVDVINSLSAAQSANRLQPEMKKYLAPSLLILDELGYMPIDKYGAELLFQIISQRYQRGSIIITSNRAFKDWPLIFNNDTTMTSAILDRLLHHCDNLLIEGTSYRMKDRIET